MAQIAIQVLTEFEAELRRLAASVKVYSVDEMADKLNELADVAGTKRDCLTEDAARTLPGEFRNEAGDDQC